MGRHALRKQRSPAGVAEALHVRWEVAMSQLAKLLIAISLFLIVLAAVTLLVDPNALRELLRKHGEDALVFLAGVIAAILLRILTAESRQDDVGPPPAPEAPLRGEKMVTMPIYEGLRRKYNGLVRRFNQLLARYRELRQEHAGRADEAAAYRDRFTLGMHVLLGAAVFSLLSLLVTLLWPPRAGAAAPGFDQRALMHVLGLLGAIVLTTGLLARQAKRNTRSSDAKIAVCVGFTSIALSGFIALAVSLPYTWEEAVGRGSPVADMNLAYFIVLLRIGAFPILGFAVAAITSIFTKATSA